jgi:hypothetical protein
MRDSGHRFDDLHPMVRIMLFVARLLQGMTLQISQDEMRI